MSSKWFVMALMCAIVALATLFSNQPASAAARSGAGASFHVLGPSGGAGGTGFPPRQTGGDRPVELRVRSGWYIDAVQFVYGREDALEQRTEGDCHGGNGGQLTTFVLEPDEFIQTVSGTYNDKGVVATMGLRTNKGRERLWGSKKGEAIFTYSAPPGYMIYGFWGRKSNLVNALGVTLRSL